MDPSRVHWQAGYVGPVVSAAWSPDGRKLVTACEDNRVRVWDLKAGRRAASLQHSGEELRSVIWSPDGQRIAGMSVDGVLQVWDLTSGMTLLTLSDSSACDASWSPDGTKLAISEGEAVRIRSADDGRVLRSLEGHGSPVTYAEWSPDGERIASSSGRTVRIWDEAAGRTLLTFEVPDRMAGSLVWSRDGQRLANTSGSSTVRVWDASDGRLLHATRAGSPPWPGLRTGSASPQAPTTARSGSGTRFPAVPGGSNEGTRTLRQGVVQDYQKARAGGTPALPVIESVCPPPISHREREGTIPLLLSSIKPLRHGSGLPSPGGGRPKAGAGERRKGRGSMKTPTCNKQGEVATDKPNLRQDKTTSLQNKSIRCNSTLFVATKPSL